MHAFRLVVCIAIAASLALPAAAAPVTVLVTVRNQDGSPVQGGSAGMGALGERRPEAPPRGLLW